MRCSTIVGAVLSAAVSTMAKELPKDQDRAAELYDSGKVHEDIISRKLAYWRAEDDAGLLDSSKWPRLNYTKCVDGVAQAIPDDPLHAFRCKNIDLYDFINHAELGSPGSNADGRTGSSTWGWTDSDSGREFVANGQFDGTSFIEILPEGRLRPLGFLPGTVETAPRSLWKELRGYKHYIIIGSELEGHGVQIFDFTKLLDIPDDEIPVQFTHDDLTGWFNELAIGSSHNVVVNEEAGYGASVGSRPRDEDCLGGLIFFDLTDPSNPTRLGCQKDDGYVHDAQCLIYRGPDERYAGRDICYAYNEDTLTIYDVTNKANATIVSITGYEGSQYTHQGVVNDPEWQEYLFLDDEYDEVNQTGPAVDGYPVTYIFDITDLENPKQTGLWKGTVRAIDHNQYVNPFDGLIYQSNYGAGLRVYDVSSVKEDPTGDGVCEVAFFDILPEDDSETGGGDPVFSGSWASYAQFESGFVWINTLRTARDADLNSCNADNCLRALRANHIEGRLEDSQELCSTYLDGWEGDQANVVEYASSACGENVISRVSSACSCLPTPTTGVSNSVSAPVSASVSAD